MLSCLVWDVDDTLYDRAIPIGEACEEATGFVVKDRRAFYDRFQRHSYEVFYQVERGELSLEASRIHRITSTLEEEGFCISKEQAERFQELYAKKQQEIRLSPGMEKVLQGCQKVGIPMAVFTNGPSGHQRKKIEALGLSRYIPEDRFCISQELGVAKPDPKAFVLAEEKLGFAPGELCLVGDSWESDVMGAKNAGWEAIWYRPFGEGASGDSLVASATNEEELLQTILLLFNR